MSHRSAIATLLLLALFAAPAGASTVLPATDGVGFGLAFETAERRVSSGGRGFDLDHWRVGISFAGNMALAANTRFGWGELGWGAGIATGHLDDPLADGRFSLGFMGYMGVSVPLTFDRALIFGIPLQVHSEFFEDAVVLFPALGGDLFVGTPSIF